jgi:hypothetical protein
MRSYVSAANVAQTFRASISLPIRPFQNWILGDYAPSP